jgi:glycosyltransferase involved in cell wall biosynthesis
MHVSISIVIITFNEEKNIGRCLSSLRDLSDDVVVVDSFSTDRTEDICKEFGVRFIQHIFDGHIEQKNWAITQALNPYILSLDADEVISDSLYNSIKTVLSNWTCSGYTMNRLTNYCGYWVKHCGWYPDTKLRLWDARLGSWGGDNPHDKFEMYSKDIQVMHLNGDILHYSYYTIEDHYKQVEYFTDILANAQFKKGKKAPLFILILSPIVKFFKDYFIKLGFLDGKVGFRICRISAFATYTKYKKLRRLINLKNPIIK